MTETAKPEIILGTRSSIRVLRVLSNVVVPLSVRQIAQQANLTYQAVNTVVKNLADTGIVRVSKSGNTRLYQLENENVYVNDVITPLFRFEQELRNDMAVDIAQVLGPLSESIIMFGSFARGDQSLYSDVDIIVVTGDAHYKNLVENALVDYSTHFKRKFGHRLEVLVYDHHEANGMRERAASLFAEVEDDGYIISGNVDWMNNG